MSTNYCRSSRPLLRTTCLKLRPGEAFPCSMAPRTLFFALSDIRENRIPHKMHHAGPGSPASGKGAISKWGPSRSTRRRAKCACFTKPGYSAQNAREPGAAARRRSICPGPLFLEARCGSQLSVAAQSCLGLLPEPATCWSGVSCWCARS